MSFSAMQNIGQRISGCNDMIPHNFRILLAGALTLAVAITVLYTLSATPTTSVVRGYSSTEDADIVLDLRPNLPQFENPPAMRQRPEEQGGVKQPYFSPAVIRKEQREQENMVLQDDNEERKVLPQALVIGAKKCGTGTMLSFLSINERVKKARGEPHFFDDDDKYKLGLEWYRDRMTWSYPGDITIEGSPAYFVRPWVPERVLNLNSSMRLVMIVRDPTKRLVSDYVHERLIYTNRDAPKYGWGPYPKFEDIVIDNTTGEVNVTYEPVWVGLYHQHLARWWNYFPKEQIHIVDGENFVKDPSAELTKIEEFLGLPSVITPADFIFDEDKGFFCKKSEGCMGGSKGRDHPEVDPAVLQKLQDFYRPHNEIFFEMIGRRLPFD